MYTPVTVAVLLAALQLITRLHAFDVSHREGGLLRREGFDDEAAGKVTSGTDAEFVDTGSGRISIQATGKAKERDLAGSDPTYYGQSMGGSPVHQQGTSAASALSLANPDFPTPCSEPPCCPVVGCIPKWTWNHQTFSEPCTDNDSPGMFWCSEEKAMNSTSLWQWCIPGVCPLATTSDASKTNSGPQIFRDASGGCSAPINVNGSAAVSCAEGSVIPNLNWCTPRCVGGEIVSINLTAVPASGPCGTKANRGNELCCSGGKFSPTTFTCEEATFDKIDRNKNDFLSQEEYDWAYGNVASSLLKNYAESNKAASDGKKDGNIFNHADFDPITYFYIMITASLFALIGVYLVVKVCKGAYRMGKSHTMDSLPPDHLTVTAPNECAGLYALHEESAGYPTWKHTNAEFYLYSGTDGRWLIGGADEQSQKFACATGLIASMGEHGGVWPQGVGKGNWSVFDGKAFVPDPSVDIIHPEPSRLDVRTGGTGAGIYVLVPDERPNGFPVWASEDGQHWIYGGLAGQWFVGGEVERAAAFACDTGVIGTVTLHDGALPNQIGEGNWMTFDGEQWIVDPNTNVVVCVVPGTEQDGA